jgi:hypothetical protein
MSATQPTTIPTTKTDHSHRCFECGAKIFCSRPGCEETEGECRKCHDPFDSPGQYYFNGRWELMF